MIDALARCSDDAGRLNRPYLSPAHKQAADLVGQWMAEAGLEVMVNDLATVCGRLSCGRPGASSLLIGSHIDSVVDAGRYDGPLGVIAGILAADALAAERLPFDLEILAFGDEEGLRFPDATIGSLALTRPLPQSLLETSDQSGLSMQEALAAFGISEPKLAPLARRPEDVLGFIEVHIEQGPVLEQEDRPLGIVTSFAAAGRFTITVEGRSGHAGTVPMALRHDAFSAAAEMALAAERLARASAAGLVATVGHISIASPAANSIPGWVRFTLDLRAPDDATYVAGRLAMETAFAQLAHDRGVSLNIVTDYEASATPCSAKMQNTLAAALSSLGIEPFRLPSGAGHDAQTMADLAHVGMLFVRCRGGVSHHPDEYASPKDMGLAVVALIETIRQLARGMPDRRGKRGRIV